VAARASRSSPSASDQRVRILQIGGHLGVLSAFLERSAPTDLERAPLHAEVTVASPAETGRFVSSSADVDIAVVVDWLPTLPASQREQALVDICQSAAEAVILVNPFGDAEVMAAMRAVNTLYRAARADDHPRLGRWIELGLPDAPTVRQWLSRAFPHV